MLKRYFDNSIQALISFIKKLIKILLPTSFKRYILLTTIFTKGVEENIFIDPDLQALNNKLCIASNVRAMENISLMTGQIWSGVELNAIIRSGIQCGIDGECVPYREGLDLGMALAEAVPLWLRYDQTEMANDIASLFRVKRVNVAVY